MSSPLHSALSAAEAVAGSQHYPAATLFVVATPIGNLADLSLRALYLLSQADLIACEDTRHTAGLLQAFGLHRPLLALHQHNEAEVAQDIIARLQQQQRIAYVSDAGTPGISDPGARLCQAVWAAGLRCMPLPGPSSVTALLSVAGVHETDHGPAFEFTGFLPARGNERRQALQRLEQCPHACVLLEAPHRMAALGQDLAPFGTRPVTLGRELTKQFEDIVTLDCQDLPAWFQAGAHRLRGEFTLVLHPPRPAADTEPGLTPAQRQLLERLLVELPPGRAVKLCSELSGAPRDLLYQAAVGMRAPSAEC